MATANEKDVPFPALYDKYPWLDKYEPPEHSSFHWQLLTASEIRRYMREHYDGMSYAQFYKRVYPCLHACQYGYDPHVEEDAPSRPLHKIPKWVMRRFVQFCNETDLLVPGADPSAGQAATPERSNSAATDPPSGRAAAPSHDPRGMAPRSAPAHAAG